MPFDLSSSSRHSKRIVIGHFIAPRYIGHGKCGKQASFRLKWHATDIRFHHKGIYNWAAEIVGPCTIMHTVYSHIAQSYDGIRVELWADIIELHDFQGYPCIEARIGSEILSPGCSLLCSLTGPTIIVDSIDIFLYFRAVQLRETVILVSRVLRAWVNIKTFTQ